MKNTTLSPFLGKPFIGINVGVSAILLFFFFSVKGTADMQDFWLRWLSNIQAFGWQQAYINLKTDYPPLFFWMFGSGNWLRNILQPGLSDFYLIKIFLSLLFSVFVIISSIIFYAYTSRSVVHGLIYTLVNIVIFHNSVALGYFDVLNLVFLGVAFIFYKQQKYYHALLFLLISLLFKWQPLVLMIPVFLLLLRLLKEKQLSVNYKWIAAYVAILILIAVAFNPVSIFHSLQHAMNHRLLSANASNMYWIVTVLYNFSFLGGYAQINHIYVENDLLAMLFKIPVLIVFILLCLQFFKQPSGVTNRYIIVYMYIFYFAFFLFNIGIHENHAVPLAFMAWLISTDERSYQAKAILLLVLAFLNQYLFFGWKGSIPPMNQTLWNLCTLALALGFFAIFLQTVSLKMKRILSLNLLMIKLPSENDVYFIPSPAPR